MLLCLELIRIASPLAFQTMFQMLDRSDIVFFLHIPTIFIVTVFYFSRFVRFIWRASVAWRILAKTIGYVCIADCFTAFWYVVLKKTDSTIPLWAGFSITALLLLSTYFQKKQRPVLGLYRFLILGIVQGVSILPGISRFAAVYASAHWMGMSGRKAFDVSWLLQFPLMGAAALLGGVQLYMTGDIGFFWDISIGMALVWGTLFGFIGFYLMAFLAYRNQLWVMAFYIILPLAISLWYGL